MTTNVGPLDRILRAALGLVLLYLAFLGGMPLFAEASSKYGAAIIGIVMLATSLMKMCPFYPVLGLKTCQEC